MSYKVTHNKNVTPPVSLPTNERSLRSTLKKYLQQNCLALLIIIRGVTRHLSHETTGFTRTRQDFFFFKILHDEIYIQKNSISFN